MLKPIFSLAAVGVAGFALWKVVSFLFLPLVGTLIGMLLTLVKVAVVVGILLLVWWLWRGRKDDTQKHES
jgi:Flp pilus assembly protein TadB